MVTVYETSLKLLIVCVMFTILFKNVYGTFFNGFSLTLGAIALICSLFYIAPKTRKEKEFNNKKPK